MNYLLSRYVTVYRKEGISAFHHHLTRETVYVPESDTSLYFQFKSPLALEDFERNNGQHQEFVKIQNNLKLMIEKKIIHPDTLDESLEYRNYCQVKAEGIKPFIQILYIFPTLKCNYDCRYCIIENNLNQQQKHLVLDLELAKKGVDLFFHNTDLLMKKTIIFYGGEPFVYPELFKSIVCYIEDKAKSLNVNPETLEISINTNGSLITDDLCRFIKSEERFVKSFGMGISIDGDAVDNNKMRVFHNGKGTFQDTLKGIETARKYGISFGASFTIGKHNIERLLDNVKYVAETLGIHSIGFNFMHDFENDTNPGFYDVNTVYDKAIEAGTWLFDTYHSLEDKTYMRRWGVFIDKSLSNCYLTDCGGMGNQIVLSPSGKIGPCHAYIGSEKFFIPIESPEMDLLHHPVWEQWAGCSPAHKTKCLDKECIHIDFCGGGCPYVADVRKGSIAELDEDACIFMDKLKEVYIWKKFELLKKKVLDREISETKDHDAEIRFC